MTIDFKQLNTISKIQSAEENGKEIFSSDEKMIFTDNRVGGDVDKAQQLAELLYKVKKAQQTLKEDHPLHDWIEKQHKDKNTEAYQILNARNNMVVNALNRLRSMFKVPGTPTRTKTQIEEEIKTLQGQSREKQKALGEKGLLKQRFVEEKVVKINERIIIEANLARKENILKLLKWSGATGSGGDEEIKLPDGSVKKLSAITVADFNGDVNDYFGNNLFDVVGETATHHYTSTTTLKKILDDARQHLTNIANHTITIPVDNYKTNIDNAYNDRSYQSKNSLATVEDNFGITFLKALRDIEAEDLKAVVDEATSSTSERKNLKEKIDVIINNLFFLENITGQKDYGFLNGFTPESYAPKYDSFQKTLVNKKINEFPLVESPPWNYVFELMEKVFPKNSSAKYLNDPSHPTYLKPKGGKNGWKILLKGFISDIPDKTKHKTMGSYARANPNSLIAKQMEKAYELKDDLTLKSLVNLWHGIFDGFYNKTAPYAWTKTETTQIEMVVLRAREEIRYIRTMRELVKALGLTSTIDELDYTFSEISQKAEKGEWINKPSRDKLISSGANDIYYGDSTIKAVAENRIWKDIGPHSQVDWRNLQKEVDLENTNLILNKSEVDRLDKKINELSDEENTLIIDRQVIDDKIKDLELLINEFDKAPVDEKINLFNTAYSKKDSQGGKWTYQQADNLKYQLNTIKEALEAVSRGDEFESGSPSLKDKKTEIQGLIDGVKTANDITYAYERLGITDVERIKNFLSEDETKKPSFTLEDVKTAFETIQGKFKLDDSEQNSLNKVIEAIAEPGKFKDAPSSKIDEKRLTELFGFTVEKALKDKWVATFDGKTLTESDINNIILNSYGPSKNKGGFDKLMTHLVENGDGFKGEDKDDYKDAIADETKKTEAWEKFIGKGPEVVIKTIVAHEFEDLKKDATKLQAKKDEIKGKDNIDLSKYGGDDVSEDGVKLFMYEEKISKEYSKVEEKKDETPTPTEEEKTWFWPWQGGWRNYVAWGISGAIVIGAACAVIFWQNIKDWWNGPAEEEGQGKTEEDDEKEEENE